MKLPRFPATRSALPRGSPRRAALLRAAAALAAALVLLVLGLLDRDRPVPSRAGAGAAVGGAAPGAAASTPPAMPANPLSAAGKPGPGAPAYEAAVPLTAGAGQGAACAPPSAPPPSCPTPPPAPACTPLPVPTAKLDGVLLPRAAVAPAGSGYLVQLGVFAAPDNALRIYQQAAAAGQPAHIQSRVVLGPFVDREAAERARKRLQAAGAGPGVLIPPERPR
ncbi:MAG TPA: SPOR domain-containing protein [Thauera aminoaromatica]|jgi:DedD protein|nr:SPOR domain-containing protein [Thauera aminoaromatica]